MKNLSYLGLLLFILSACSHDNSKSIEDKKPVDHEETSATTQDNLAIPNNQTVNHFQILLMGNSHVKGVDSILIKLIETRFPEKQITSSNAHGAYYLSERIEDNASMDTFLNTDWTHIILQAQKYSTTGAYSYPTDAAKEWIRLAKAQNSTPIMFPEHPQRGNETEGMKVYLLHKSIVMEQTACVSPIGPAWDRAISLYPEINLYHSDGNHANETGKLLSALVFYQTITGELADALPYIQTIEVSEQNQDLLGQVASYALEQNPACDY